MFLFIAFFRYNRTLSKIKKKHTSFKMTSTRNAKNYDHLFKLLLIGDSGVGKTCILFRFADDQFNTSFISTIGIDFKIKTVEINGKRVKLQIWDTAGQERFHTITTSYYRGANGIMMCYDITNTKSFDNITKWLRNIADHASEDVLRILLGNKADMEEKRMISTARGQEVAQQNGIKFYETSAKNNTNIEEAFITLATDILDRVPKESPKVNGPSSSNVKPGGGLNLDEYVNKARDGCC